MTKTMKTIDKLEHCWVGSVAAMFIVATLPIGLWLKLISILALAGLSMWISNKQNKILRDMHQSFDEDD